jgi:Zn-dependent protease
MGLAAALLLFASVLVHELAHSIVTMARGQQGHSVTLFVFGKFSNMEGEAEEPKDQFLVAVVEPVTRFTLAGAFWLARQAVVPGTTPLGGIVVYVAFIDVLLGACNLVPVYPLDGGRALQSIIWAATGSLWRATRAASSVGQCVGFLLI